MFATYRYLIGRELTIALRRKADIVNPLLFYLIVVTLFPLGIGPEPNLLLRMAPGIVWVAALLSSMLALERLFRDDFLDGTLEQMLLLPVPASIVVLAKVTAHWLLTGLPIVLFSPLLAVLLGLDINTFKAVLWTLLIGTPALSLLGAIGVALTVGIGRGGVLVSLLILPLYIPVLIFATSAIDAAGLNMPYNGQLAILAAFFVGALVLAPIATAAALKVSNS
ncbi:heme exporter protein CcmB [Corallincola platygyrae]|uniref:Heme exporter protein B n=1 Tax=Corallincola platygyrae TaxID=1193278 RepID=A0ABW4XJE2_9GAMM